MEKENNSTTNQKFKITELLKELVSTQVQVSKVEAAQFQVKTKNVLSNKISELKQYLDEQSKTYKQSKADMSTVIENYENILSETRKAYRNEKQSLMQEKEELQKAEMESISEYEDKKLEFKEIPGYKEFAKHKMEISQLRKQGRNAQADKKREEFDKYKSELPKRVKTLQTKISLCIQNGDVEQAESQIKTLKRLQLESKLAERDTELTKIKNKIHICKESIKEQNEKIEKCEANYEEEVEKITSSQEKALSKIDKQNIFQKIIVKVFGSAKQFDKNVVNPLKQKMQKFKEETLPKKIESIEKSAKERRKNISEKTGKAVKTVSKTFTNIIDGAKKAKDTVVNGLEQKMTEKIYKNKQKVLEHNLNNSEKLMGKAELANQYEKYKNGIFNSSHNEI